MLFEFLNGGNQFGFVVFGKLFGVFDALEHRFVLGFEMILQGFLEAKNLLDDTQYRFTPHEYREIAPETTMRWDNTFVGRKYYTGVIYTF